MINDISDIAVQSCSDLGGAFQEGNGEENHYHLLVQLPPNVAPGRFAKLVKGRSSKLLREKYWDIIKKKLWGAHLWSPSYYCSSTGGVTLETVRRYVQQQGQDDDE